MRSRHLLTAIIVAALLAACSGESNLPQATGKGTIRAINAIKTAPAITFLIEERALGSIGYKGSSAAQNYDDLAYNFNFEVFLPGDTEVTRIASQRIDVASDTSYTIVLSGQLAAPDVTVWERPTPEFSETGTVFEVQVGNAAESMGSFDAYFAAPGTPLVVGEELGTFAMGDILPPRSLEAGDYVLTLTAPGDPSTVLFQSNTVSPAAGAAIVFSTFDTDANDLAPVSVQAFNLVTGSANLVADASFPPEFRFFHASLTAGPVDIYIDDPLTTPLVANHAFGDITDPLPIDGSPVALTYTTAGNMGSILIDIDQVSLPGLRSHVFFIKNSAGEDALIGYRADLRSVETTARLSVVNTASNGSLIDLYILPRDAVPDDDSFPLLASYPPGLDPVDFNLVAGQFDLFVTVEGEKVPLAGPVQLDLALGDVITAILLETADPNVVDVDLFTAP